jgi:hypothetical protein
MLTTGTPTKTAIHSVPGNRSNQFDSACRRSVEGFAEKGVAPVMMQRACQTDCPAGQALAYSHYADRKSFQRWA